MKNLLLKNGSIVNEGEVFKGSIVIAGEYISQIIRLSDFKSVKEYGSFLKKVESQMESLDLTGLHIFPGVIDSHVHFREPGDGWKGNIESESRAAVLGGVTSFMDMPNNTPPATTRSLLEDKFASAEQSSYANYSFYLGASNSNIAEIRNIKRRDVCGVKLFMGSSTGNLLVDNSKAIDDIFRFCPTLIAVHCEDNQTIASNLKKAQDKYGKDIPAAVHPDIRSREACIKSSAKAVELALKYHSRLHILHVTTREEVETLSALKRPAAWKASDKAREAIVTAETCPTYLWFCREDYSKYGNLIKCNPAIKDRSDMFALRQALKDGAIQTIGSDHAPHLLSEKLRPYAECPSGIPLMPYSLQIMLTLAKRGEFSLSEIADKMSHSPARCFAVEKRGFIRAGYFADFAVVDMEKPSASASHPAAMCRWSPFSEKGITYHNPDGTDEDLEQFPVSVVHTFVSGCQVVENGTLTGNTNSRPLTFNR